MLTLKTYLNENIDDHVTIEPWQNKALFPVFLRDAYNFHDMVVLGVSCILIESVNDLPGADTFHKHLKRVEILTNRQGVLYHKKLSRYRRKSLIKKRIPFVIDSGQMYLPFLGLDLKRASQNVGKDKKAFSTSAQLAYLYFLYHQNAVVNATDFAKKLGLSVMTASRALNDLYHANLVTYEIGGRTRRSKQYKRISDPVYFHEGVDYIKNPVRKVVYANKEPEGALTAGLEALAQLSMINPPDYQVKAISREQFNKQKVEIINNYELTKEENVIEVQIWDYDPRQFSDKNHVDHFSLYVSLKEENDERVEQALEEVLRGETWFKD
jgi:DNA-binding transcriptional ArsR family regulator